MSIGSVGSQSPMQHSSLSIHSQPSSIPNNDQNIVSPNQQTDTSPQTPPIHRNSDQKPDMQNSMKIKDEQNRSEGSQPDHENSDSTKAQIFSKLSDKENQLLKRPALMIQDCENNMDEDFTSNQLLYDYSTWDAWYDSNPFFVFIIMWNSILSFKKLTLILSTIFLHFFLSG